MGMLAWVGGQKSVRDKTPTQTAGSDRMKQDAYRALRPRRNGAMGSET